MKRKTHEEFLKEVYNQVGEEYTVKDIYININKHLLMRHEICGYEWEVTPANFLRNKSRCPLCNGKIKVTTTKFIKKLEDKYFGNVKLISDFTGLKNNITVKFIDCGHEHTTKAVNFLYKSNNGCNICNTNAKKTTEQFKQEVFQLVNDEYTVLGEYNGSHIKILIRHNICNHEYNVDPAEFLSGKRCPKCQHRSYKKTTEEFKEEVYNLVGSEYEILEEYIDTHTKILFKHNKCGTVYPVKPCKFIYGRRCPICNESHGEQEIRRILNTYNIYYIAQKIFDGLIGLGNGNLSYDFYLPQYNLLIEYQGEQHEKYTLGLHKSYNDFEKQLEHDRRKQEYAQNNNINLLEIWYWDFENIEEILQPIIYQQTKTTKEVI